MSDRTGSPSSSAFWPATPGIAPTDDLWGRTDPKVRALHALWGAIAPAGLLPGRQHLDPASLPTDLLPNVMLLDVVAEDGQTRFRYRLVGTAHVWITGRETTGQFVDMFEGPGGGQTSARLMRVVTERGIAWCHGGPRLSHSAGFRLIENIALPMARDGRTVDMILALSLYH